MLLTSPLRYPGGKGKIYNRIKEIIENFNLKDKIYVEPFSGGCSLGIMLLSEKKIKSLIINDLDIHIYAVWHSILNECAELCNLITNTNIDINEWKRLKNIYDNYQGHTLLEIGFATLFLNRTNFSGILKAGPIGGYSQKGKYKIGCRFNKESIISKIIAINKMRENISLYNLDANILIKNILSPIQENFFVNIDPPYVDNGAELYTNFYVDKDHIELSKVIKKYLKKCNWIITYDNHKSIKKLYKRFKQEKLEIRYSVSNHKCGEELIIYHVKRAS